MGASRSDNAYPQFFKMYQPQYSSETLMIPPAFEERIRGKIPNRVIIKDRKGKIWLVQVGEREGGLFFEGGWSKFVMENSLEFGDFLVFKYSGQRIFEVLVLGKNGCEKELPEAVAESEAEESVQGQEEEPVYGRVWRSSVR